MPNPPRPASLSLAVLFAFGPALAPAVRAQDPPEPPATAALRAIADRQVTTEAEAARRKTDATAWLEANPDAPPFLLAVARRCCGGDEARAAAADLAARILAGEEPPPGFGSAIGNALLFHGIALADAGEWDACRTLLPHLLRYEASHRGAWWLLGRRGRDAGTPAGTKFLQEVVVPGVLADPTLPDDSRVDLMRRLWKVEYTGPRPFTPVCGVTMDGKRVSSEDWRGKVLLVDYWATWCVPCMQDLPHVAAAYRALHDRGFDVLGITLDEAGREERVQKAVAEHGATWPQIMDGFGGASPLVKMNGVHGIPATFLLDRQGRVRHCNVPAAELEQRVRELLDER